MAKRIHERLRDEHGFASGITSVTDYVRDEKRRTREDVNFGNGPFFAMIVLRCTTHDAHRGSAL